MKVLITGATGLIGSRLAHRLLSQGYDVSIFVRESSDTSQFNGFKLQRYIGEITRIETLYPALKGIDVVFHAAGFQKQWSGWGDAFYKINVLGGRNLLNASLREGVKRVVALSSTLAVGITDKPEVIDETFSFNLFHQPYAMSKYLFEKEVAEACKKGLDVVIVNPATVFGPGDRNFNAGKAIINALKGKYIGYPPGGTTVVDVEDVVTGIIAALKKGKTGERYILGNECLSFHNLLNGMADVLGIREPKIPLPAGLLWVSAWTKELLSRYLTKSEPYPSLPAVEMSIKFTYVNSHKAKQELGFIPQVNFKRSIENAYQWYVEQGFVKDTIVNG